MTASSCGSNEESYVFLLKGLWSPFLSFTSMFLWPQKWRISPGFCCVCFLVCCCLFFVFCFFWGVCLSFVDLSCLLEQLTIFSPVLISSTGICETSDSYQSFISFPAAYKVLNGNCGIHQNLLPTLLQDCTSICSLKKPLLFHAYLEA